MAKDIYSLLKENRGMLVQRWTVLALQTYPSESARFYSKEKNQFANPVGHAMNTGLGDIFDAMVAGQDVQAIAPLLDSMVRIRAVQGFAPSRSLAFLLYIKQIIRDELGAEIQAQGLEKQLSGVEQRVDGILLVAFDVYAQCRQSLADIKSSEFINRHARLLKRANLMSEGTRLC